MKLYTFFIFFLLNFSFLFGQVGGKAVFEFLNLPTNARLIGLGKINITSDPEDVNLFMANPALTSAKTDRQVSLNFLSYYQGISQMSFAYRQPFKWGSLGLGVQYLNYGTMDSFDAVGNPMGTFGAQDYALYFSYAHTMKPFTMGTNLKLAGSGIAGYNSFGVLFDFGGIFQHPTQDFRVGLVIKNLGFALSNYTDASRFQMPFDVQIGTSFRPAKMPFRFSLTAHHLQKFDMTYNDPNLSTQLNADLSVEAVEISTANKIFRHVVIGAELLLSKFINFRIGYNFQTRNELKVMDSPRFTGLSFGIMLKIKGLELGFGHSIQHLAGGMTSFTATFDTSKWTKNGKNKTVID